MANNFLLLCIQEEKIKATPAIVNIKNPNDILKETIHIPVST